MAPGLKARPTRFREDTASVRSGLVSLNVPSCLGRPDQLPRDSTTISESCRQQRRFVTEPKHRVVLQAGTPVLVLSRLGARLGSSVSTFLANSTDLVSDAAAKSCVNSRMARYAGSDGWNEFSVFIDYTRRFCGTLANLLRAALLVSRYFPPSLRDSDTRGLGLTSPGGLD